MNNDEKNQKTPDANCQPARMECQNAWNVAICQNLPGKVFEII